MHANQRPDENVIDRQGYVGFINDMSDNAFTAFQYDEQSDEWGYFPVKEFDQLPADIRGEFYTHACGGPFVICENAFLYTDGTAEGEVPGPQQEVYLYQVCIGVEAAIEDAMPEEATTPPPTPGPTGVVLPPTAVEEPVEEETYTGEVTMQLTYHAVVSPDVTTEDLQSPDDPTRQDLLNAMTSWSFMTGNDYYKDAVGETPEKKRRRDRRGRRVLQSGSVRPVPLVGNVNEQELMKIVDVGEWTISYVCL